MMTEVHIMEKLRQVVSEDDPKLLYSKIKKVDKGELSFFAIFGANFFFCHGRPYSLAFLFKFPLSQ